MAINTDLFINLITQFKNKGIKDAEKGFKGLLGNTNTLNKSLSILARRVAVFETLRRSFKGFVEDDAAARRLNQTLTNLGLSFSALGVEDYLDKLEKATAVNNDQLRPSFESLARVTGNFEQTQSLLNTALDVAAGTGQSVTNVSRALARAYAGNTTALARLNAGLSKATLASGNFALIQERLNNTFAGQAQTQVSTYQGQVELLKIAAQDAGDAIGKGMVDSLIALNGGDVQKAVNFIVASGEFIGDVFRFAAKQISFIKDIFTKKDFFSAESQLELFEKYNKASDPARTRAQARERREALLEETKTAEKLAKIRAKDAAAQKKAAADQKKAAQDRLKLEQSAKMFDDQLISIEAALKNESLDRNEILRLQLKKALINENANRAEELAEKLAKSQSELAKLQDLKLTNDPFSLWMESLEKLRAGVANLAVPVAPANIFSNPALENISKNPPMIFTDPGFQFENPQMDFGGIGGGILPMPQGDINIYVSGTGQLSDDTKQAVVDAVVEASGSGFATGWYRTTNRVAL